MKSFRAFHLHLLLLIWVESWKKVPSVVRGDELMPAWVWSPTSTKNMAKMRDHRNRGAHANESPHFAHERKRKLLKRSFTSDLVQVWFVEDLPVIYKSVKVLSFILSHTWKGPAGRWKSAKSCRQGCVRCETALSPFYYLLSHKNEDSNAAKIKTVVLFCNKWKHLNALKEFFPMHVYILAALNHRWLV